MVILLRICINDELKVVEIWSCENILKNDIVALRDKLSDNIDIPNNYRIIIFNSGTSDLTEETKYLLTSNIKKANKKLPL